MPEFNHPEACLVAVDFSTCSLRALEAALSWHHPHSEITVLHVLDSDLARRMEQNGVTTYEEAVSAMRSRAEQELTSLVTAKGGGRFEVMVVEGSPFVEIVKIAHDLDCDLIVMGSHGTDSGLTELLFGSTAEKVLRAARRPVLCIP